MANESTATRAALAVMARHRKYLEDAVEATKPEPYMQQRVDNVAFGRFLMRATPEEAAQQVHRLFTQLPPERAKAKLDSAIQAAMRARGMR